MKRTRRQFIKETSAFAATPLIHLPQTIFLASRTPSQESRKTANEVRLGFMARPWRYSTLAPLLQRACVYTDYQKAIEDVRRGEITHLVSASDYHCFFNKKRIGEGLDDLPRKWVWGQCYYTSETTNFYSQLGLESTSLGLWGDFAVRISDLTDEQINQRMRTGKNLSTVATEDMRPYLEAAGLRVLSSVDARGLSQQMKMLGTSELDLTDAFFLSAYQQDILARPEAATSQMSFLKGKSIYLDKSLNKASTIELITHARGSSEKNQSVAEVVKKMMRTDSQEQKALLFEMARTYNWSVYRDLPLFLREKMNKLKQQHIAYFQREHAEAFKKLTKAEKLV